MATLVRQKKWYYAQFYNSARSPKRKRVPLKTRTKKTADKLIRQLENEYAAGEYDPWTGYRSNDSLIPVDDNSTVEEALDYYIEKKSREDWRENTTVNTSYILNAFARFVGKDKSVREVTPAQINAFLNRDKYAYETKKSHKKKIDGFANWLTKEQILQYDFSKIKIYNNDNEQDESISYLSQHEIQNLVKGIREKVHRDMEKGYQHEGRNALWLIDFIHWQRLSGMRISETLNLYPKDINTDTWEVRIGSAKFSTKSKSKQVLPIGKVDRLKEIAKKLLHNVPSKESRLFQHKCRRRTSRTFKKYVRMILPEREDVTVHTLRHTCCIELLRKGVPIYTVQRWMRHSSVKTTQKYADLLATDISDAIGEAFNG
ncbi:tyrosine-type recombinase/integrase [Fodinibius sp. AD559]|uniref:tyrosine-type recombinase/integrase n=1 Tax=Fodinibius sp. AD559 TaxID=3424179 RepID=UPI004046CEA5